MPIQTILDLSTVHMTMADESLLRSMHSADDGHPEGSVIIAYPYEHGWTVSTSVFGMGRPASDPAASQHDLAIVKRLQDQGYSREFGLLLVHAYRLGCTMVRLDRDGEVEPDLPVFDWGAEMATAWLAAADDHAADDDGDNPSP